MSEIEPPVINKELTDQKPFVIRAHHLGIYIILIKDGPYGKGVTSPAREARVMRSIVEAIPSTLFIKPDGSFVEDYPGFLEYSQDVIGTSAVSADRYEERIRETFEKFISLPDDYPAEITEEVPDAMCEACAVGEHCRSPRSFASRIPGADMNARESEDLDEFLKNIRSLNLPEPVISYEQAHFPDADPEQVRRIKTTIGVVRKVLKETESQLHPYK